MTNPRTATMDIMMWCSKPIKYGINGQWKIYDIKNNCRWNGEKLLLFSRWWCALVDGRFWSLNFEKIRAWWMSVIRSLDPIAGFPPLAKIHEKSRDAIDQRECKSVFTCAHWCLISRTPIGRKLRLFVRYLDRSFPIKSIRFADSMFIITAIAVFAFTPFTWVGVANDNKSIFSYFRCGKSRSFSFANLGTFQLFCAFMPGW